MYAFRNSNFTKEQLTNLGVTGKDVPIAAQTPLFPPMLSRPLEIAGNVALDYKVVWKEDFRGHLFDVHSKSELNLTDDSYSSKVANAVEKEHKKKIQFKFAWSQMPAELRPQNKRKSQAKPNRIKRIKAIPSEEVEKKIKILEQKEKEAKEGDDKSVKADNESDEEFDNEMEEIDQEMDDENDYGNNYFDNGEGFDNDEDDNLEGDGPIY